MKILKRKKERTKIDFSFFLWQLLNLNAKYLQRNQCNDLFGSVCSYYIQGSLLYTTKMKQLRHYTNPVHRANVFSFNFNGSA